LACSGLHTTPAASSHLLDLGLSRAPGSFAPRDGYPETNFLGLRLAAFATLTRRQHRSRGEAFILTAPRLHYQPMSESLSRNHWTGSGQPVTPVRILPKKVSLDRTAPPSICHLEQFRHRRTNSDAPHTDVRLSTRQFIRLPIRSRESIFLFTAPARPSTRSTFLSWNTAPVLRSARTPVGVTKTPLSYLRTRQNPRV